MHTSFLAQAIKKADAVAPCLKCSLLFLPWERPVWSIFILTNLSTSPRGGPEPLSAVLRQGWPHGAVWGPPRLYNMHGARLIMHFRAKPNYSEKV